MLHLAGFLASLYVVIKSAQAAIRYAGQLAHSLRLSKYLVGFLIVAAISILPETFISIDAALQGVPSFGLGTLFGSNVADLTLVFAVLIFVSKAGVKIESKIITKQYPYLAFLVIPLLLGLNGHYSRIEGVLLIASGVIFYSWILWQDGTHRGVALPPKNGRPRVVLAVYLLVSMALLLAGAHFTVVFGVDLANALHIAPHLIGLLIVGVGTTMPELFFSVQAIKRGYNGLALGDILGTVMTDATIVVGIVALVRPFAFSQKIIYVTVFFMVAAAVILFRCMKTGQKLTKKEALFFLLFYAVFIVTEWLVNR